MAATHKTSWIKRLDTWTLWAYNPPLTLSSRRTR